MFMFKKYAKNFLEKEIISSERMGATDELLHRRATPIPAYEKEEEKEVEEEIVSSRAEMDNEPETVIGEKVVIKGYLSFERLLRIDGTFEGELISQGKLIVGPTGSVKANINLEEAFIAGKVDGDIEVKERLVLRGRAEVRGNISAPSLSVDEGVTILGQLTVATQKPLENKDATASL